MQRTLKKIVTVVQYIAEKKWDWLKEASNLSKTEKRMSRYFFNFLFQVVIFTV